MEGNIWRILRQESKDRVTVRLFRYDPTMEAKSRYENYEIPFHEGMSILHALKYIYDNFDQSLAFRYSCENELCGLCGVVVNGKPVLACREKLKNTLTVIDPLHSLPVIRDLVVDASSLETKLDRLLLDISMPTKNIPKAGSLEERDECNANLCNECHICNTICSSTKFVSEKFILPEGIVKLAQLLLDPCDKDGRQKAIYEALYYCALCWECTEVCPRDVRITGLGLFLRNSAKESYFPGPFERIVKSVFATGHEFPFTTFTSKTRNQLCLSERPPVAINSPGAVEEIQTLFKLAKRGQPIKSSGSKE